VVLSVNEIGNEAKGNENAYKNQCPLQQSYHSEVLFQKPFAWDFAAKWIRNSTVRRGVTFVKDVYMSGVGKIEFWDSVF